MRAITFRGVRDLALEEVPDPRLIDPQDALVRVRLCAICGSDLHPYRGDERGLDRGTVMGHEFLGEVIAVGDQVRGLAVGTLVVSPFTTSCGHCHWCRSGLSARCELGELFGWVEGGHGLHGGQAELVRVPLADTTLVPVPAGAREEEALLAGDVLSTGFFCAEGARLVPGSSVAVLGAGPVGLMAAVAAFELGAQRVYALDVVPERLALARRYGAIPLDHTSPAARERIFDETGGRGVDAALECVGAPGATRLACSLVRLGGTIVAAGVHTEPHLALSPGELYDRNLTYRAGRCPARSLMERTLPLVAERRLDLAAIVSHRLPLEEGVQAYDLFDRRADGCTKVLLTP